MDTQNRKYVAAIDIGTTKIVAVAGYVHRTDRGVEKVEILSYGEAKARGMQRGMVYNLQEVISSIKEATEKARFKTDLDIRDLYVGVSGYMIRSMKLRHQRLLKTGIVTEADVKILTEEVYSTAVNENEQVLHVIPYEYFVDEDYANTDPTGLSGKRLDGNFFLIISDNKFVNNIRTAVERAGFNIKRVIFEPLASAEAVLTKEEREGGVAMLDIGGGTTDLVVYHDNKLIFSKVIPFGGNTITQDIRQAFQILADQAEEIKIKEGTAIAAKNLESKKIEIPGIAGRPPRIVSKRSLAIIIQARMTEIIDTVYKYIEEFIQRNQVSSGITITGGGALLKDLEQFVRFRTDLDVRIARPLISSNEDLNQPQYATTLGLLIKGDEYERKLAEEGKVPEQQEKQEKKTEVSGKEGFFKRLLTDIKDAFKPLISDVDDEIN